ncbi:MAG: hydroxyphenylacetyl-CoA thioesterase PaaI [Neisseriaceae bacterium]|nr:hydroxyphenylacetyl-CoA thioesterase PaaI [Neisseriaceae bacterium]
MLDLSHPQTLAEATVAALQAKETLPGAMNMQLLATQPGYALLSMKVADFMLNAHGMCHGGMIFSLADTAFAYACNNRNQNTVGAACSIDFTAPAFPGETLQAEATETFMAGRTGVYDVVVKNEGGQLVALFRGKSHRIRGEVLNSMASTTNPNDKAD